jgi:hypothetical protein
MLDRVVLSVDNKGNAIKPFLNHFLTRLQEMGQQILERVLAHS